MKEYNNNSGDYRRHHFEHENIRNYPGEWQQIATQLFDYNVRRTWHVFAAHIPSNSNKYTIHRVAVATILSPPPYAHWASYHVIR